jgi:hypothetical protein
VVVFKEPFGKGLFVLIINSRAARIRNHDCNLNSFLLQKRGPNLEFAGRIFVYNDIALTVQLIHLVGFSFVENVTVDGIAGFLDS